MRAGNVVVVTVYLPIPPDFSDPWTRIARHHLKLDTDERGQARMLCTISGKTGENFEFHPRKSAFIRVLFKMSGNERCHYFGGERSDLPTQ